MIHKSTIRLLPALFYLSLLAACAGQVTDQTASKPSTDNFSLDSINSSVEFLSPDRTTLPANHFTNKVVLLFPYISGGIFGNADSEPVFYNYLTGELEFSLDLKSATQTLDEVSTSLSEKWLHSGLSITPAKTRISRIGTFAYNAETGNPIGAGGFIDTVSRDNLILLYTDRACEITGELRLGRELYIHTIDLPTAGFHWLRVHSTRHNQFEIKYYPHTMNIKFSIHLLQLTNV